jgi:hypothetical protein
MEMGSFIAVMITCLQRDGKRAGSVTETKKKNSVAKYITV